MGEREAGLAAFAEVESRLGESGERWPEAEIHRLKGELTLSMAGADAAADRCFRTSIEVARGQQAKSSELRAARSLAHLWRDQGHRANARDLLAPVYGWFTEGFDTADLKDAKALLDELRLTSAAVKGFGCRPVVVCPPALEAGVRKPPGKEPAGTGPTSEVYGDLRGLDRPVRCLRWPCGMRSLLLSAAGRR